MQLPDTCIGCPLYNPRAQFVPDKMPFEPIVNVFFDAPAKEFSGRDASEGHDAQYFRKEMAPFLQIDTAKIAYSHLLRCRAAAKVKGKVLVEARDHCRRHDEINNDSNLLTPGFLSWQYFSQRAGSRKDWGGFFVEMEYHGTEQQPTPREQYRPFDSDDDSGDDDSVYGDDGGC